MVWTRLRAVCCRPRKTGPVKLVSSIVARESSHQGVQGGPSPVRRVPCWTKELIPSSYDGVRSGSSRRPVAPSCVCACGADHVTTSRLRVRTITAYSLSRQTADPCRRPPAHRARVASHPTSSIPSSCSSHACWAPLSRALVERREGMSFIGTSCDFTMVHTNQRVVPTPDETIPV